MLRDQSFQNLYDGFEGESLSYIWSRKKLSPGAAVLQSEIVRKGKQALQLTVRKGDNFERGTARTNSSERNELYEKDKYGPLLNETYCYCFSLYIPQDFPIVSTRLVLAQWKRQDSGFDNPILALRYQKGRLFITIQTGLEKQKFYINKQDVRDQWLDFKFQMKFSRTSGFFRAWMNNRQVLNHYGPTVHVKRNHKIDPQQRFYFKMGLYRDTMEEPMTVYIDEFIKKHIPTI